MGGVRMSEDEGDEKERSIISLCFQDPAHACAQAFISMCRYIHVHLHQLVHGYAHMPALTMHTYAHNVHTPISFSVSVHTVSGEEESMQLAPGSPLCTHIHHSVVGLTEPSAPQAMSPHIHTGKHTHLYTLTHRYRRWSEET